MGIRFEKSHSIKIQLGDEQWKMISSPDNISRALQHDNIIGFDIYDAELLVGFAMLRRYSDEGWFLWDYAIDRRFQNMAYGQKALLSLIDYMKQIYYATEISTTYIWGNSHAKYVYEKVGFVETDIVDEEDCHEVNMIYSIPLQESGV